MIRTRQHSEYCLPEQRENNTKQSFKYIPTGCLLGQYTHKHTSSSWVSLSPSVCKGPMEMENRNTEQILPCKHMKLNSAEHHIYSYLMGRDLAPPWSLFLQGACAVPVASEEALGHKSILFVVWAAPGLMLFVWDCFPKCGSSFTFSSMAMLSHAMIRHNPCSCVPGEVHAHGTDLHGVFHTAQHTFVAGEAWAGHAGTDTL